MVSASGAFARTPFLGDSASMRALRFHGIQRLALEEVDEPLAGDGDAIVAVTALLPPERGTFAAENEPLDAAADTPLMSIAMLVV